MKHLAELARQVAARNIKHVFGIPGSGPSLVLLDELEKRGVHFHLTHFEGSAALMAGAMGKLGNQSGVAISIKGPGLTNMLPGLAACCLEAFPLVSVSESYLPGAPAASSHKRLDHWQLLAGVAKFQTFLSETGSSFESLCQLAEAEVPGVVHLNIAASPCEGALPEMTTGETLASDADLESVVGCIRKSQKPVIIAGTLAVRKHWSDRLNCLSLPVFSTAAAKGVIDETRLHAAGVFTGVGGALAPETKLLPQADLVVALGLRHNEVLAAKPFGCPAIQVDPLGEAQSAGFKFNHCIAGTPAQLDTLFGSLAEKSWGLDLIASAIGMLKAKLFSSAFLPAHVYAHIAGYFNNQARLVLDTGNFCIIGEHVWQVPNPGLYLASGQGRYMGVGLPLGVGAAIYDPSVPTILGTGDGGVGMFVSEVKLAVQHKLPLLIVLLSDSFLGSIRSTSLQKGYTQQPTAIYQPSWRKAMEGFGVPAERIRKISGLEKALAGWSQKGPLFLEILFDPDDYQRMTDGIR